MLLYLGEEGSMSQCSLCYLYLQLDIMHENM